VEWQKYWAIAQQKPDFWGDRIVLAIQEIKIEASQASPDL
jgi:hypothetical protein